MTWKGLCRLNTFPSKGFAVVISSDRESTNPCGCQFFILFQLQKNTKILLPRLKAMSNKALPQLFESQLPMLLAHSQAREWSCLELTFKFPRAFGKNLRGRVEGYAIVVS
ncbi:MAG: hypothetical protein F6K50_06375 [Moorea sp. SIO3I7]|nr:hypothetical protein [Moorena sp. SIO3I7]